MGVHCISSPQVLNRGTFHLENFTYQDMRQWPILLTIAYARCLQHWVEKHNLPKNPDFCPWAECVRELQQTVWEFVNITYRDVMQGLEIEKCEASHPGMTIFSRVLANPINEPRVVEDLPSGISSWRQSYLVCLSTPGTGTAWKIHASSNLVGRSARPGSWWWQYWENPKVAGAYSGTLRCQPYFLHQG